MPLQRLTTLRASDSTLQREPASGMAMASFNPSRMASVSSISALKHPLNDKSAVNKIEPLSSLTIIPAQHQHLT
ncbi:hypothetical protein ACOSQ2_026652 [Xanthoceras sorbifolium]